MILIAKTEINVLGSGLDLFAWNMIVLCPVDKYSILALFSGLLYSTRVVGLMFDKSLTIIECM